MKSTTFDEGLLNAVEVKVRIRAVTCSCMTYILQQVNFSSIVRTEAITEASDLYT